MVVVVVAVIGVVGVAGGVVVVVEKLVKERGPKHGICLELATRMHQKLKLCNGISYNRIILYFTLLYYFLRDCRILYYSPTISDINVVVAEW